MTRKLTVDKHEGQRIVDQYRESRGHRTDGTYGTLPAHSTLPARGTLTAPSSYPVHSAQTGTLQMGTLSRQDQGRRPMRKGSRSSSKDEDLYASPLDLVGPQGPQHELARQHGIPGDLSPVYDRISPSSSGFCSGKGSFKDITVNFILNIEQCFIYFESKPFKKRVSFVNYVVYFTTLKIESLTKA